MKKVGYFFFAFVPFLAVQAIQIVALCFMIGSSVITESLVGHSLFPSRSISDRLNTLWLTTDFNMMIMLLYSIITIIIFSMWYYAGFGGNFLPSPKKTFHPLMILGILFLVPGAQFAANYIVMGISFVRPDWISQYEQLFEASGITTVTVITFIYSVITGPICEELIFRGMTMNAFKKAIPFWAANIMQAILFGIFHMNWVQGIYAFALGLLLGYVCEKGNSIYYSIGLHILFNFWGTVVSQFLIIDDTVAAAVIILIITIVSLAVGFVLFESGRRILRRKAVTA